MNLYVTTDEIKSFMGISGSTQNAKLLMLNKAATALLNRELRVSDLALHKVTDEVQHGNGSLYRLRDMHVGAIIGIADDETAYTQTDAYDIESLPSGANYVLNLEDGIYSGYRKAKFSYVAGWNATGMTTIVVSVSGMLAGATLTLGNVLALTDGFTITRGVDWTGQATDKLEAAAIAAALDAKTNIRSFSVGNTVYVIEDVEAQLATRSISTNDASHLALGNSTLGNVDFPEDLRLALFTLIASLYHFSKNPRLKSYTIGQKTLTFASKQDADSFEQYLKPYVRARVSVA